ncbi:spermatogenesis-defective protein 39 homolog [Dysidea avara]|uniref:spermatogenesis-defective protein 39 homolog n=1 Tax=Dysidea avara TaxID=196820 RepID=UPI0033288055
MNSRQDPSSIAGSTEQRILDTPPTSRGKRFDIDWDNEDQPISFDEADLHFTKAKVKKAKPVGGFSGDVDTIGEPKFRQRERPSKGYKSPISPDQNSLSHHAIGGEPSSTRERCKTSIELQTEIDFLKRQIETFKEQRWKGPPIEETVRRLLCGKPCALDYYKSKEEKKELLQAVINTLDSNCIMKVILYIRATSRIGVLVAIVKDQPVAINHFASYLRQNREFDELIRFYEMIKDMESAGMVMYEKCKNFKNPIQQLRQLDECDMIFRRCPELTAYVPIIQEHAMLLKKQIKVNDIVSTSSMVMPASSESVLFHSVITTLFFLCRYFYKENNQNSPCNPRLMKTEFKLSEQQYQFMAIKACASQRNWKAIEELLTVKAVFGSKLKCPIGFKNVVKFVCKHNAPEEVRMKYLNEVSDIEEKIKLATDYKMHNTAIDLLSQIKDQKRLEAYFSRVPPGSEECRKIQFKLQMLTARK